MGSGIVTRKTVYQLVLSGLVLVAPVNAQQARFGAHAVGLVTHATPAMQGQDLTEGYLSQPGLSAHLRYKALEFSGMLNLEGLTLKRGELNAGVWGEGYMDRRHPHTYLHEAVLSATTDVLGSRFSLSAGRGFAPFGTDDPMARHFVKYPTNHHLSQILERLVLIGAVRSGPVIFEGAVFNGDEPLSPEDVGSFDRFGDSWSARATLLPVDGIELSGSLADVTSPEQPFGGGLDHVAWNAAARFERNVQGHDVYALVEVGRASERSGDLEVFHFNTALAEVAVERRGWGLALRLEQSDRPEEERQLNLFRSVRPATDNNILGTTEWTVVSARVSRTLQWKKLRAAPFIEVVRASADPNEKPAIIDPEGLYGSSKLWSFSIGIRSSVGMQHRRMGRYGAALPAVQEHTH